MRQPHAKWGSGFTLIELMVTLTVLAILLVAAAPSFTDFFERYRLRSAVDDSLTMFAQARQAAVESDRNVNLKLSGSGTSWCLGAVQAAEPAANSGALVSEAPGSCDCSSAPAACVVDSGRLVTNADGRTGVTASATGASNFTYDSKNGTLREADIAAGLPGFSFVSSKQNYGLTIQITALGQARACVTSGKRPIPGYKPC